MKNTSTYETMPRGRRLLRSCLPLLILLLWALAPCESWGQVCMPTHGHKDTTASRLVIYDDGGPNASYSPSCNGTYTVHAGAGHVFRILVHFTLHSGSYISHLQIFDGDSSSVATTTYRQFSSTSATTGGYSGSEYTYNYFYYSTDSIITLKFACDDDNPLAGFKVELEAVDCYINQPSSIHTTLLDTSADLSTATLRIRWNYLHTGGGTATRWMLVYRTDFGNSINGQWGMVLTSGAYTTDTVYSDTNFIDIPNYPVGTTLMVDLKPVCDSAGGGAGFITKVTQYICNCIRPDGLRLTMIGDSLVATWDPHPQVQSWGIYVPYYNIITTIDTNRYAIFWPDSLRCQSVNIRVSGNCDFQLGRPCNYNSSANFQHTTCSSPSYFDLRNNDPPFSFYPHLPLVNAGPHHLTVAWEDVDTLSSTRYQILCRRHYSGPSSHYDTIAVDTVGNGVFTHTFTGLEENTEYEIRMYGLCSDGLRSCGSISQTHYTTLDQCLDYTNFADEQNVHLTSGTYQNPYRDSIFFFSQPAHPYPHTAADSVRFFFNWLYSSSNSHTVMRDTTGYDSNTGSYNTNHLRTVPQGYKASVKLGNNFVGAKAESITYDYTVDTNVYDLLMLKYALVMQNPNHTIENQPHFTLELLDENGHLIDSTCSYADFYAADNLEGFNYVAGSNVLWKDWTTIGIDLAPYQGQHIKVRLTNKDCAEGGHWAYAYFTLACDNKRICLFNYCDAIDSIHMVVPEGFEYQWTRLGDSTVVGTSRDILLPIDSTTVWLCRCSFVGKPWCYFTMESYAIGVFPRADYTSWVDSCRQKAYLVMHPFVDVDTSFDVCAPQGITDAHWILEDGSQSQADTLVISLDSNRTYRAWLVASLTQSFCKDTALASFPANYVFRRSIEGPSSLCQGDTLRLTAVLRPAGMHQFEWNHPSTDSTLAIPVTLADTAYWVSITLGSCVDTLRHHVEVHPTYNDTIRATICQEQVYGYGFNADSTGFYSLQSTSTHGCDSLSHLLLTVQPYHDSTINVALCHDTSYLFHGHNYFLSGTYLDTLRTTHGCDSLRCEINLTVQSSYIVIDTAVCHQQQVYFDGQWKDVSGSYALLLTNQAGCDSMVRLNLYVAPPPTATASASSMVIQQGDSVTLEVSGSMDQWFWFRNGLPMGFDSLLVDHPNSSSCYVVLGRQLGPHQEMLVCEASDTLCVAVNLDSIVCPSQLPLQWNGHTFTGPDSAYYQAPNPYSLPLPTLMTLGLHPTYDDTLHAEICQGQVYDSCGFSERTTGLYTFHRLTRQGCDSLLTLHLLTHPVYSDTLRVATCDQPWGGHAQSGFYVDSLRTVAGCDSVVHLDLLRKTASVWGDTVACEGDRVTLHATDLTHEGALYFWQAGGGNSPTATFLADQRSTPYLLDIYLNDTCSYHLSHPVVVHPTYDDTMAVDLCHGSYDSLGFHAYDDGIYTLRLRSIDGCDSLSSLLLIRRPNYYDTLVARTCDEPYVDNEWYEETSGFYTHSYRTVGYLCDSILNLDFVRWPVFHEHIVEQVLQLDTFSAHGFYEWEEGQYQQVYTDLNGCDSVYDLDLQVVCLQFPNVVTANGDGINDLFEVYDLLRAWSFDHNELWIYDRNGRVVFHRENISQREDFWDPNATHSPTGSYFYRFQARSLSHAIDHRGVVEVLR